MDSLLCGLVTVCHGNVRTIRIPGFIQELQRIQFPRKAAMYQAQCLEGEFKAEVLLPAHQVKSQLHTYLWGNMRQTLTVSLSLHKWGNSPPDTGLLNENTYVT